jgi:U3 small nucleolar RNA-associated protein 14
VSNYEYEMPSDFEDEEIDEEMAFTEEDNKKYGSFFDDMGDVEEEDEFEDGFDEEEDGDEDVAGEAADGEGGWLACMRAWPCRIHTWPAHEPSCRPP